MDYRRVLQIMEILRDERVHSPEQLELALGVGNRMMRRLMKELDEELQRYGAAVQVRRGEGYYLDIRDRKDFEGFEAKMKEEEKRLKSLPETADGRVGFLLSLLLRADGYRKMDDIAEQLYISRRALSEDLKKVKQILRDYDLELESRPNYGIRIIGEEKKLRSCLAACDTGWMNFIPRGPENKSLGQLADTVMDSLERYKIRVSDVAFQNLTIHIYIALQRIRSGHYMPPQKETSEAIGEYEYGAASQISQRLGEIYQINFPESETEYIAMHLAGKRMYGGVGDETEQNTVITQEIAGLAEEMLQSIYDSFRMDFRKDLELHMALCQHLGPLTVRIRYGMKLKNPLLKEIREQFSFPYVMADQACSVINQHYNTSVSEDEIGYIALTLALALERNKHHRVKKNILLVCSSGRGSAQLLLYQYREKFGEYLDRIEICDSRNLEKVDFSHFDYVFSTVPIHINIPIPIQEVGAFIEEQDVTRIKRVLTEEEPCTIEQYFPQQLFFGELDVRNRSEALRFLCEKAVEMGMASDELYGAVKEREKVSATSFGNLVAMPHPNFSVSEKTFVSVGILKEKIDWGGQKAQAVFLVSTEKNANKQLQLFYQTLSRFLMSEMQVWNLIRKPRYETLIESLRQIERDIENGGR